MSDEPRYASLRDYLALLRRQRWIVLVVPIVFAVAAYALSEIQDPRYEAAASVEFRDLAQDFRLIESDVGPALAPAQRSATSAEIVTSSDVARRVKDRLDTDLTIQQLQAAVTAQVGTQTNLVEIRATASDPLLVSRIANTFASQAAILDTREQLRQIDELIDRLRKQAPGDPIQLDEPPRNILQAASQQRLFNLQSVREIAEPAEVVRRAQVPAEPVAPKPVRNAALAGLVGLALALLAAFLRDSLDRRIRGIRHAHEELGLPVLGRVGTTALGKAGVGGNGRVPPLPADTEAFQMLRTNLAFFDKDRPVRTVLVTSGLPEEGKTTVAASLASAAAATGQSTLLVDADLRRPMVAQRLGVARTPGLSEYLAGTATPQEILQVHELPARGAPGAPVARPRSGENGAPSGLQRALVCIAAGQPPPRPAELLASARAHQFLQRVGKVYDLVVIDTSPLLSSADPLELIPHVDAVMLCVRVSRSTRDEAKAVLDALARLPERPTGVVVTGLRAGDEEYGYYGYAYGA